MRMKKLLVAVALLGLGVLLAGQGAWGQSSGTSAQRLANLYLIDQLEVKWHRATSKKDLNLMMSLFAPTVTLEIKGTTFTGKAAARQVFAKAAPFQPQNHWESDTPAYKIRTTVNGNRGTIYFECHYVDVDTSKVVLVVGGDNEVRKINGKWLFTKLVLSSPTLKP
jgi:hypothetical protein